MNDLRSVLVCNKVHLKSFEIDIVDWDEANDKWDRTRGGNSRWDDDVEDVVVKPIILANFLAWTALQSQPTNYSVVFPALTELSLSNISFNGAAAELACAFNGSMLRSLRLQNCRNAATFLLALIDLGNGIRLRLFHLSMDDRDAEKKEVLVPVNTFLEAFEGLEELGLLNKPGRRTQFYTIRILFYIISRHSNALSIMKG